MQQRVEFRKHGLLVLGFDNQSGDGQKDAAQGEEKGQGLGMKQAGYYCSPNAHQESANYDRPVLDGPKVLEMLRSESFSSSTPFELL